MRITFAPEAAQDWDGMTRVFTEGLVGATVEITYKEGWAPLAYPDDEDPDTATRPVTDFSPTSCDITEVVDDDGGRTAGLELAYDDGSVNVFAPFHTIEEVKYL